MFAGFLLLGLVLPVSAAAAPPFGPKEYVRAPGAPLTVTERFATCRQDRQFWLRVANGPDGLMAQCGGFDTVDYGEHAFRHLNRFTVTPITAATVDLVELEPPETLTELFGYSDQQPPRVRQVLVAGIGPSMRPAMSTCATSRPSDCCW